MDKIFKSRVKHKRDTEANWVTNNPVLLDGEMIFVDMTNGSIYMKVGDGVSRYNSLPFVTFGSSGSGSGGGLTELDVRNIIQEYTSIINENYENLKEEVSLNSLVLSELGMKYTVDIEDTYDERVTAGGGNVLDNSKAKIRKVIGNTQRSKNLVDIPEITASTSTLTISGLNITEYVWVSAEECATVSKSIWRINLIKQDGSTHSITDDILASGGMYVPITSDNPVVSIQYRGTYITSGRYAQIMIAPARYNSSVGYERQYNYQPYGLLSSTFGGVRMSPLNIFDISQIEESANIVVKNNSIILTNADYAYTNTDKTLIELFPYIEVGKTYTFSAVKDYDTTLAPTGPVGRIAIVSPVFTTLVSDGIGLKKGVFTITEEFLSSQIYLYGDTKTPVTFSEIMCIEGDYSNTELPKYRQFSEIKDFVFSKTETPLGTTIDFENKTILEEYAQYTFKETDNFSGPSAVSTTSERWYFFPENHGGIQMSKGNGLIGICDKFERTNSWTPPTANLVKFGQQNRAIYFFLPVGLTHTEVKALLNGVTVRYPTDNITSTPFTAEQEAVGNEYIAKTLGKEEILDNDGKQYGVSNTLIQNYVFAKEGV
ncbi:MAG: hypothetical protein IJ022_07680 [Burkholderiaceae bacterium]|nr:hypothetical protein [Burkholderiaceae bacterium]